MESPKDGDTVLTPEEAQRLIDQLEAKFGPELQRLHESLVKDVTLFGQASSKTIRWKKELMERILREKHKNERLESEQSEADDS